MGRGTVDGAPLSAVSVDKGVDDMFCDSDYEVWYGEVRLQPMLFQDDVMRMAEGVLEAQVGNIFMETVAERKLLSFNQSKSVYMVVGKEKNKKKIFNELERNPLTLCGKPMKQAEDYLYLGTVISDRGVSHSAALSVSKKIGRVKHLIHEIKTVIQDCRNNKPGAFCTAIQIWEMAVVPYLYFGAECWIDIPEATLKTLNYLEESMYLSTLAAPHDPIVVLSLGFIGNSEQKHLKIELLNINCYSIST